MSRLPAVKPKVVLKALQKEGWFVHHKVGSHHQLKNPERPGKVTVPFHNRDLRRATLKRVIDQAGYTVDEFLEILKRV